ncbi:UNVERIFIED_CONTAM: hypothetical protein RMT77_011100 [Armadillidium vulgare]
MMPNLKINNRILVDQIKAKLIEWKETYPYCQKIITVPYIHNFGQYNNSRLYHKLPAHQVKTVYNYGYTLRFTKQMKSIIEDFFQCWTRELNPKPLALPRLENHNRFVQKLRSFRKPVQAYQVSTKDGLHFANNTIKQFWKVLKTYHDQLNKVPRKAYHIIEQPLLPSGTTSSGKDTQRNVKRRWRAGPQARNQDTRHEWVKKQRNRQDDLIVSRTNQTSDLRYKIQNRQNQLNYHHFGQQELEEKKKKKRSY